MGRLSEPECGGEHLDGEIRLRRDLAKPVQVEIGLAIGEGSGHKLDEQQGTQEKLAQS